MHVWILLTPLDLQLSACESGGCWWEDGNKCRRRNNQTGFSSNQMFFKLNVKLFLSVWFSLWVVDPSPNWHILVHLTWWWLKHKNILCFFYFIFRFPLFLLEMCVTGIILYFFCSLSIHSSFPLYIIHSFSLFWLVINPLPPLLLPRSIFIRSIC